MTSLSDFSANTLAGQELPLSTYDGKVVLVVNTASKCGLTPQFEGLEALYKEFSDEGLVILGFPCNQFAGQEPGDSEQIGDFCTDVRKDRRQRQRRPPPLQVAAQGKDRSARRSDQVELHQVPPRSRRQCH